jgi:ribosomal protein S18 acetylase RimI-like enzyme
MFHKIISLKQARRILASDYFPPPFQVNKRKDSFCVSLNDGSGIPRAQDHLSSTGIDFNVYYDENNLFINHLHVLPEKRRLGYANMLLAPLLTFYADYRFRQISLISTNHQFWRHITQKFPWVKFCIDWR